MADKIVIPRKGNERGEDGYKYTSVRLRNELIEALDTIAGKANRSRNEIITIMLAYCVEHAVVSFSEEEN